MSKLDEIWEDFVAAVGKGAGDLAENLFADWKVEAKEDAEEFVELSREKLPKWTEALVDGHIDKAEFNLLVRSLEALAQLNALKAKGLAKQKLEQFRVGLVSVVVKAASAAVGL